MYVCDGNAAAAGKIIEKNVNQVTKTLKDGKKYNKVFDGDEQNRARRFIGVYVYIFAGGIYWYRAFLLTEACPFLDRTRVQRLGSRTEVCLFYWFFTWFFMIFLLPVRNVSVLY